MRVFNLIKFSTYFKEIFIIVFYKTDWLKNIVWYSSKTDWLHIVPKMMEAFLWNKEFDPIKRKYIDESKVRIYTSFHFQFSSSILQTSLKAVLRRITNPRDGKFSVHNAVSASRVKYYKTILGTFSLPWNFMACKNEVKSSAL